MAAHTIESLDEQIAKLTAARTALANQQLIPKLVAQGIPGELAKALVSADPEAIIDLGRALEWTSRDEPGKVPIPVVEGFAVAKTSSGVEVSGAWLASLTNTAAQRLGVALIRVGHHRESGLL